MEAYDVVIVGGGMAGLTAAAYLTKENYKVLVIEKDESFGGLLGAFEVNGHLLDKGARGIIDSGILFPMIKQLGLTLEFSDNPITMMIEDKAMTLSSPADIDSYQTLLINTYPDDEVGIRAIIKDIKTVMKYMDVLYGIENPLFLPKPYDLNYLTKTLLPWMGRFIVNINKAMKLLDPIYDHLQKHTNNQELIHIIAQHFFEKTPTFFALSYFTLYTQYNYPIGSTKAVVDAMVSLIKQQGGEMMSHSEVVSIDPINQVIATKDLEVTYNECIWAADTNFFYKSLINTSQLPLSVQKDVKEKQALLKDKKGADSILTLYLMLKENAQTFKDSFGPHCFYTKFKQGLSKISLDQIKNEHDQFITDKDKLFTWVTNYLIYNTFEISIPSLRDPSCSPTGESTLIISTLFDYELNKHIAELGYYEDFKKHVTHIILDHFEESIDNLQHKLIKTIIASPLTIVSRTNNHQGSVTGWSFANKPFPAEFQFLRVSKSVLTPIKNIKQAGQWTFNPAGVPVAVLTGKLAADAVSKSLKKRKR